MAKTPDAPRLILHERALLRKYDGDDQTQPPVEVIEIEDGRIVGRWEGSEVANAPTE